MGASRRRSQPQVDAPRLTPFRSNRQILVRLVDRLEGAIRTEEEATRRSGGGDLPVCDARLCGNAGRANREYRLTVARERAFLRPGAEVSVLAADRPAVAGHVVRAEGRTVWVLAPDLGDDLSDLSLRSEAAWLWTAVRHRLREIWPSEGPTLTGVAPNVGLIVDLLCARTAPRASPVRLPPNSCALLNPGQRNAVTQALAMTVHYLWGPPGTGKTLTLATLVEELMLAERSVLVVAPSNAAADVIAIRIAERCAATGSVDDGSVLRFGRGAGPLLRSLWADRLLAGAVARRLQREGQWPEGATPQLLAERADALEQVLKRLDRPTAGGPLLRETGRRVVRSLRGRAWGGRGAGRTTPDALLRRARVVITTAHQLALTTEVSRTYDTVVVDEASQASLPLVLLAAAHARSGIVVAGDPRQLPPPTESRDSAVGHLLGTDLFTLSKATEDRCPAASMLVEQHRMAPEISDLVSRLSYDGVLRTHENVLNRRVHPVRRAYGAVLYRDTSSLQPCVRRTGRGSRVNDLHVDVIRRLVRRLHQDRLAGRSGIVVITPFAAQAARLTRELRHMRARASTVHAFQGGEADVVILDLTDAPGMPLSRFLSARAIKDDGGRLLTVATSRAREALIVVADFEYLQRAGGAVVKSLLRSVVEVGRPLDVPGLANAGRRAAS